MLSEVKNRLTHESTYVGISLPKEDATREQPCSAHLGTGARGSLQSLTSGVLAQASLGLRQEELRGLTVDRVKFLKPEVVIDCQPVRVDAGVPVFGPPKTLAVD